MSELKRSLITFNSQHRSNPSESTSKFTIDLGNQIETQNITSVQIKNFSFVNVHYNINQYNNVFVIDDGAIKKVTLPEGQYTIQEILDDLTLLLSGVGITIVFSTNNKTGKISVDSCVPPCEFFDLKGSNVNWLGRDLGIVGNSGFVGTTTFTDLPDVSGLYQVNIHSRQLVHGSSIEVTTQFDSATNSFKRSPFMGDCVKTIPVDKPFGFQMVYENSDQSDIIHYDSTRNLKTIDIELRDTNNRNIDLQGTHTTITLLVEHLG
jgi:hypothetical protein